MWVPLDFTIILLRVCILEVFGMSWWVWAQGVVSTCTLLRYCLCFFARRTTTTLLVVHELIDGSVTCSLKHGIYTACIIFLNTFGATGVCALCSDKQNKLNKPNFEHWALKIGGWPTFEGVI